MGVPERPREFTKKLEKIANLIESRKVHQARKLLDKLAVTLGSDDPAITALEWELADTLNDASGEP
jgi:hypothetical protein